MADEELRISVKVDQEKAAENTRLLKDSFRSITDVQHVQRFEALGRQFQLTDVQLKQLGTAILKPNDALSGFAAGFGRAGAILLAFDAAVAVAKAISTTFSDAASRQLDISNAAKRMGGIHAAQLDANVHAMERERIERGRGIAMMENFSRRRAEFLEHSSQFKRSIMEDVEGPFADVVRRHFAELNQETDPTDDDESGPAVLRRDRKILHGARQSRAMPSAARRRNGNIWSAGSGFPTSRSSRRTSSRSPRRPRKRGTGTRRQPRNSGASQPTSATTLARSSRPC